jgi:hypothetical protein
MLVLRRPDGSVAVTLYGKQVIGEIIERYAWEDSAEQKRCRVERACERFLQLPATIVLRLIHLAGAVSMALCVAALYCLWSL